ncbi:putative histidine kinase [Paratrimastix pyriformis]|uniref:histidine kinase n=1 Tax=Paratrimastix pyriformis TaxID=342808 RepID=A0ABQ8UUX9_9EUKA|nr:putative histidine kinase [Paratrimastix pyriformis]
MSEALAGSGRLAARGRLHGHHHLACARRLSWLVGDILDFEKVKRGEIDLDFQSISVPHVARNVVQMLSLLFQQRGLALRDKSYNLLGNSLGHTVHGSLISARLSQDRRYVETTIADTGVGIPSDKLPAIFERFQRVKHDRAVKGQGGTGLGLSVTRDLVRLHGGRIYAASELDRGTEITFAMPVSYCPDCGRLAEQCQCPVPLLPAGVRARVPESPSCSDTGSTDDSGPAPKPVHPMETIEECGSPPPSPPTPQPQLPFSPPTPPPPPAFLAVPTEPRVASVSPSLGATTSPERSPSTPTTATEGGAEPGYAIPDERAQTPFLGHPVLIPLESQAPAHSPPRSPAREARECRRHTSPSIVVGQTAATAHRRRRHHSSSGPHGGHRAHSREGSGRAPAPATAPLEPVPAVAPNMRSEAEMDEIGATVEMLRGPSPPSPASSSPPLPGAAFDQAALLMAPAPDHVLPPPPCMRTPPLSPLFEAASRPSSREGGASPFITSYTMGRSPPSQGASPRPGSSVLYATAGGIPITDGFSLPSMPIGGPAVGGAGAGAGGGSAGLLSTSVSSAATTGGLMLRSDSALTVSTFGSGAPVMGAGGVAGAGAQAAPGLGVYLEPPAEPGPAAVPPPPPPALQVQPPLGGATPHYTRHRFPRAASAVLMVPGRAASEPAWRVAGGGGAGVGASPAGPAGGHHHHRSAQQPTSPPTSEAPSGTHSAGVAEAYEGAGGAGPAGGEEAEAGGGEPGGSSRASGATGGARKNSRNKRKIDRANWVLVCDDDPINIMVIRRYLSAEFHVVCFSNGFDVIRTLYREVPLPDDLPPPNCEQPLPADLPSGPPVVVVLDIMPLCSTHTTRDQPLCSTHTTRDQPLCSTHTTRDQSLCSTHTTRDQSLCSTHTTRDQSLCSYPRTPSPPLPMPHIGGFEVCTYLRRRFNRAELPVLFLSAASQARMIEEAFQAGGNAYIQKPIQRQELLAYVHLHCRMTRLFRHMLSSTGARLPLLTFMAGTQMPRDLQGGGPEAEQALDSALLSLDRLRRRLPLCRPTSAASAPPTPTSTTTSATPPPGEECPPLPPSASSTPQSSVPLEEPATLAAAAAMALPPRPPAGYAVWPMCCMICVDLRGWTDAVCAYSRQASRDLGLFWADLLAISKETGSFLDMSSTTGTTVFVWPLTSPGSSEPPSPAALQAAALRAVGVVRQAVDRAAALLATTEAPSPQPCIGCALMMGPLSLLALRVSNSTPRPQAPEGPVELLVAGVVCEWYMTGLAGPILTAGRSLAAYASRLTSGLLPPDMAAQLRTIAFSESGESPTPGTSATTSTTAIGGPPSPPLPPTPLPLPPMLITNAAAAEAIGPQAMPLTLYAPMIGVSVPCHVVVLRGGKETE